MNVSLKMDARDSEVQYNFDLVQFIYIFNKMNGFCRLPSKTGRVATTTFCIPTYLFLQSLGDRG